MNGNDLNNGDDKQHSEDEGTGMINDQTSPSCVGNSIEERFDEMDAQIRSLETILEARLYANFDIISNDLNDFKMFTMNNAVEQFTNELQRKNDNLKKENECLTERLTTVSYIVAHLNTKKDLEYEKASLVTTIKIIHY